MVAGGNVGGLHLGSHMTTEGGIQTTKGVVVGGVGVEAGVEGDGGNILLLEEVEEEGAGDGALPAQAVAPSLAHAHAHSLGLGLGLDLGLGLLLVVAVVVVPGHIHDPHLHTDDNNEDAVGHHPHPPGAVLAHVLTLQDRIHQEVVVVAVAVAVIE